MTEFYPFNIRSKQPAVPPKLKALAEQVAAQICGICKSSREIVACRGYLHRKPCGIFPLRPGKARLKELLRVRRGTNDAQC